MPLAPGTLVTLGTSSFHSFDIDLVDDKISKAVLHPRPGACADKRYLFSNSECATVIATDGYEYGNRLVLLLTSAGILGWTYARYLTEKHETTSM